MKRKARIVPISQINSSYWQPDSKVVDTSGSELPWYSVMLYNPDYGIYVDDETETPITGLNLSEYYLDKGVIPNSSDLLGKADAEEMRQAKADERVHKQFDLNSWLSFLGSQAAGAAAAGGLYYALPVVDAALTPSTWLDLAGAPKAWGTVANLMATGAGVYHNGKNFLENPTYGNAAMTALSFIPMTRANAEAIEWPWLSRELKFAPLALEIDKAVDNTHLFNMGIGHVTPNGTWKGPINSFSEGDVGFHFYPLENWRFPIEYLKLTGYPYVKEGYLTFSNNTRPINAGKDVGNWSSQMNPDLYKSTSWSYPELDDPLMQDAMQLNQKSSNWYYTNNWEDKGSTSFMSTEPTFGLQFSKNIENPTGQSVFITKPFDSDFIPYLPIQGDNFQLLKVNPKYRGAGLDNLRYLHSRYPGEGYNIVGNDFNELYAVNPINKDVQAALIDPHKEDLINYLKSAEYARRLKRAGLLNKRDEIVQKQIDRINNTEYTMAPTRTVAGLTRPTHQGGNNVIVFSTGATDIPNENVSLAQLYAHEGGHTKEIKETAYANANLIKDWKKLVVGGFDNLSKEEQDFLENYIMNINTDGTEISGQMQAPILDMWKNKMTPEQMLYEYDANPEFERFKQYFKDSFIERLLKDMVYLPVNNKEDSYYA